MADCHKSNGKWVRQPVTDGFFMGYKEGGPVITEYEGVDATGGTITTTTTTTATTKTTTTIDYEPLSGQVYTLFNCKSGTALGLSGTDSRTIVGSIPRGLDEQWKLEQPRGSGMAWRFCSMGSGKYLDFEGDAQEGTRIIGSRVPRNWKMRRDEECPSTFRIYVPKMSLNIELANGDDSPGVPITLEGFASDKSQVWRFEPVNLAVTEYGDEIISTTTTTTVSKVKVVTKVKKARP